MGTQVRQAHPRRARKAPAGPPRAADAGLAHAARRRLATARSAAAEISVATRGGPFPDASPAVIRRRAGRMLDHLGLGGVELSVALVDDAVIRELNRSFRKKNKPTDVLSFPMNDPLPGGPPRARARPTSAVAVPRFVLTTSMLGDVILSVETARRQAAANSRPLLAELTMLLAHGVLHLLGYDHRDDAEERAMTAATQELTRAATARSSSSEASCARGRQTSSDAKTSALPRTRVEATKATRTSR